MYSCQSKERVMVFELERIENNNVSNNLSLFVMVGWRENSNQFHYFNIIYNDCDYPFFAHQPEESHPFFL